MTGLQLTILTCTFNRRGLLPRLHASIAQQGVPAGSYEWLVVNDGSTDDTGDYLSSLAQEDPHVRVTLTPNGGKYRCLNIGAQLARAPWTLVIDSDDYFLPGALPLVMDTITKLPGSVGMLAGLLRIHGAPERLFAPPANPCRYPEWVFAQGLFDFCPIFRTHLAAQYLYPERNDEKYMAESWRYEQIALEHSTYFMNRQLVQAEYLPDGLSAKSRALRMQAPVNAMIVYASQLKLAGPPKFRIRAAINFWRYYFHARRSGKTAPDTIARPSRLWAPGGWSMFLQDVVMSTSK